MYFIAASPAGARWNLRKMILLSYLLLGILHSQNLISFLDRSRSRF